MPDVAVDDGSVGLDDAYDLVGDVGVGVGFDGGGAVAVALHPDGHLDGLDNGVGGDGADYEHAAVDGLLPLGRCAHRNRREVEYGALFGKGAAVAHHAEGIHLQFVVVKESERFVKHHVPVKTELPLFDRLAGTWMTGIDDRHSVGLGEPVDRLHQRDEVGLDIDVFLTVGGEKNVLLRL